MRVRGQALGARVHREEPVQTRGEVFALDVDLEAAAAPRAEPRGRALFVVVVPSPVWKSKFYGAFVLNHRVVLHAIDATPARCRGDAGSSLHDGATKGSVIAEK